MKAKQLLVLLVIAFLAFSQNAYSQPDWKWVKWSEGTQTTAKYLCADAAGNLYAAGTFNSQTKFDTTVLKPAWDAVFLVKYSASGVFTWARMIENPGFLAIDCKSLAIDPSGNLYVTGAYKGTIKMDTKTLTGSDQYLAKYDNNGNIQWAINTFGSNAVIANAGGIYIAGGETVRKHDATGAVVWTLTGVKSNVGYTNFFSLAFNKAGNLLVAGDINDKWTFGTTVVLGGNQNIIIMAVGSDGVVGWAKVFGNNIGGSHAQHLTTDASDNIIMTGKVGGLATATCSFGTLSLPAKNAYLVKLNSAGTTLWGTVMTNAGDISGSGVSVATDAASSMFVTAGTTGTLATTNGGSTTFLNAMQGSNAFILKFDSSGIFLSALTNKELSSPYVNVCSGLALTSGPGSVYFAGRAGPYSEWGTLKASSSYGSVFAKIEGGNAIGLKSEYFENGFLVYPNPSKGIFKIEIQDALIPSDITLQVLNVMGEVVYLSEMNESGLINLDHLPPGIYCLQIQTVVGLMSKNLIKE